MNSHEKNKLLNGIACLAIAQTLVALNIVCSKLLLPFIPVLILLEIRFVLATITLLLLHWVVPAKTDDSIKDHFLKFKRRDWLYIFAQSITAGASFNCLMLTGLNYTDANVAGIITSALPAIIAIMAWIILSEKISAQKILCIFCATAGLMVIAFDKLNSIGEAHSFLGDSIVFLSLIPESAYYVLCKLYPNKLPIFLASALFNGINAILLFPVFYFTPWALFNISFFNWILLILISLSSGFFYVCWFSGAQRVDGVMASLTTAIMPVATVILAWGILGEQLTLMQLSGMSLVLFSVFIYARR